MSQQITNQKVLNTSTNESFDAILERHLSRRTLMRGSLGAAAAMFAGVSLSACGDNDKKGGGVTPEPPVATKLGFSSLPVPASFTDACIVPEGYEAFVIGAWGSRLHTTVPSGVTTLSAAVGAAVNDWKNDGTNTSDDLLFSTGMHHDGMHFFPLDGSSTHGILVLNNEYIDENAIHAVAFSATFEADGSRDAEYARKEINAHGVSVMEVRLEGGAWKIVENSTYNRRFTSGHGTDMVFAGPIADKPSLVTTPYSTDGKSVRGTNNNCGNGHTPWGTYLTCEENWAACFTTRVAAADLPRNQKRLGVSTSGTTRYRWEKSAGAADERQGEFSRWDITAGTEDATKDWRNEINGFGYIVEIDPYDPASKAVKRTSMGRFAHEGAAYGNPVAGKPLAFYSGDDSRFEYIYKFVSDAAWDPKDATPAAGKRLETGAKYLDKGTLYVAKFFDNGTGVWLKLTPDALSINGKTLAQEFAVGDKPADLADIILHTREAADLVGATKMDRPEWTAVHPTNGDVYLTLTNNSSRRAGATGTESNGAVREATGNAANPRLGNVNGHIIRWHDDDNQVDLIWDVFVFGDHASAKTNPAYDSGLTDLNQFASPDGLVFDSRGILWIQTDNGIDGGRNNDVARTINDQMLAVIPAPLTKGGKANSPAISSENQADLRRFFIGPNECEVTGLAFTPDNTSVFLNIQHPANWPAYAVDGAVIDATKAATGTVRPRSSTVVIRRKDGGKIGE